jgi:hypothetical protein
MAKRRGGETIAAAEKAADVAAVEWSNAVSPVSPTPSRRETWGELIDDAVEGRGGWR